MKTLKILALAALAALALTILSACGAAPGPVQTPTSTIYMATVTPVPADSDDSLIIEIQISIGSPTEITKTVTGCVYGDQYEELNGFANSVGVMFELQEGKWKRAGDLIEGKYNLGKSDYQIDGGTPLQEKMTIGSYCAYFFQVNNYPDWLMRPLYVVTDVREVNGKKEYFVQHIQTDGLIKSEPQMR